MEFDPFAATTGYGPTGRELVQNVSDVAMKLISESVDVIRGRHADGRRVQSTSKDHRVDDLHITVRETTAETAGYTV